MNNIQLFALPGNEALASQLAAPLDFNLGRATIRRFPDGETYVKVESEVKGSEVYVLASLHQPDGQFLPLYFLCTTLRELGAVSVKLVAPYLAYMRQDKRFFPGECLSSNLFARLLSGFVDELITIDPHLHRLHHLEELYSIPVKVLHAAPLIARWIRNHVSDAVLVGPDEESEQWVAQVAQEAGVPYTVLQKTRTGDRSVDIKAPDISQWKNHTPVLVDDIISTAQTMMESIAHLKEAGPNKVLCIGVHGIFAGDAYEELLNTGAQVHTTNSIPHPSNSIAVTPLLVNILSSYVQS
jgi:ribose-phosphate pyrophosphokinase